MDLLKGKASEKGKTMYSIVETWSRTDGTNEHVNMCGSFKTQGEALKFAHTLAAGFVNVGLVGEIKVIDEFGKVQSTIYYK